MDDANGGRMPSSAGTGFDGVDLRSVVAGLNEGIWGIDRDGITVFANAAIGEILRVDPAAMVGHLFSDFFHPDDRVRVTQQFERRQRGHSDNYAARLMRSDGTTAHVQMHASPVSKEGTFVGAVAAVTDLTDLHALMAAKDDALRRAEQSDQTKSKFLSWVGHELRTPLNTIAGFAQLLQTRLADDELRQMAAHIVSASSHLNALVQELLDYSSAEAAVLSPALDDVDLADAVAEAVALVGTAATDDDVRLEVSVGHHMVRADRRHLVQVVVNLLSNAIKYGGPHSAVRVSSTVADGEVSCSVADDGPGIPADRLHAVFSPFERLENSVGLPGVGLGLSIAEALIRAMNGRITATSRPGHGATFTVSLPAATPADDVGQADGADRGKAPVEGRLVVYLEDEPLNAALVESVIGLLPGRHLTVAPSVADALRLLPEVSPALVLLDLNLPDGSGLDVLRAIRSDVRLAATPVFMLSADATEESTLRARELGATRFITKPFDLGEFLTLVEAATDEP